MKSVKSIEEYEKKVDKLEMREVLEKELVERDVKQVEIYTAAAGVVVGLGLIIYGIFKK